MSKETKNAANDLRALLKSLAPIMEELETRGRRLNRIPSGALGGIMGISLAYFAAFGASLEWEINPLIFGTLSAPFMGSAGVLVSRRRRGDSNISPIDARIEEADQMISFLESRGHLLPTAQQAVIAVRVAELVTGKADPAPPLLPPPNVLLPPPPEGDDSPRG